MRHISAFTVPSFLSIFAILASAQASPKPTECSALSGDATSTLAARCTPHAADRFTLLPDDSQFVFNFNQTQEGAGDGGMLVVANRKTFPALVGTGSGMAVGRVGPCGLNTFHTHPRSAELQLVVQGRLVTEMMPENGIVDGEGKPRVIKNEIGTYQMTPFYQGSVHTQFNPDCSDAVFVAAFSSEDPGAGQVVEQTIAFTDDLIAAAFGQSISGENLEAVRKAIPSSIAFGVESCLERCGIEKKSM
ncbi:spherulin-1B [Pyricularia oryzae 70-15]|uniref:Spherulin-1B n=1 Tax=Pyricularia oryzae (strain 70-15 / ATCC MYA-4617 / FGSC 8958) TaxID=242507 RepID=G4N1G3_PYRO7|nr:spherulin-1B [Pyricularia oryzae 70-15]EHA53230.1 spherulin-1B [Pyricularia oryzae 70-15]